MKIHIGAIIKAKVKQRGITVSEFGRRLNTSRENVYSIFNRASINTGILSEISKIPDYDFFSHYPPVGAEVEELKKQVAELRTTLDQILKMQK